MEALDGSVANVGTGQTNGDGLYNISYADTLQPLILRVSLSGLSGTPTQVVVSPAKNERVDFKLGTVAGTNRAPRYTDVKSRIQKVMGPNTTPATLDAMGVARLAMTS